MPYKFKGKRDCTQSGGSKGKFQTVKNDGSKRCYKTEKQYKASQAWAHEYDEAGYGEEINEDIARILVGDFTLEEGQAINPRKHYLDSGYSGGAARAINYMTWLSDGMPTAADNKPYADDIENFINFRNSYGAFETFSSATLFSFQQTGDLSKDEIELGKGTKIQLLEPMSNTTINDNKVAMKGRAVGSLIKVKTQQGLEGYLHINRIHHNLAGTSKGKINDAEIGAAIESVVFAAINGLGRDEAFEMAVRDPRAAKYPNASDSEKARFESLMKSGYDSVENYLSKDTAPSFSDPVDPRPQEGEGNTAAVDVPVNAGGQTAEIHVKYNDKTRMFGLRKADGSKASPEFTKARNAVLSQYVPTLPSYMSWVSSYKKRTNFDPYMIADLSNKEVEGRLRKFGTIEIGPDWNPMTEATPEGASNVFLDPRSLVTNMHKDGIFQSGISSLMQLDPLLLAKPPFDLIPGLLKTDVENAIRPNADRAPGGVYYFNFSGKGSTATLEVMAFAVDLEVNVVVHNSIEGQSSKSKGYDIQVEVGGETLTPFQIQISSLARGKPLQVGKTSDLPKLLSLIDPEKSNKVPERVEKVIEDGLIRKMIEELTVISESQISLIIEELTGADKSEIKKMIAKEIEGTANKKMTQKVFQAEFNKELKKALGVSFIGEPGKINKFVADTIQKEIEKMFKDKATQNQIGEITKAVIKKLYRELSYSSVHIVDRIKL
ncbi:MAG: hypothetical protein CMB77_03765 [Euryarchaeota archaeon]|nr:hypothetical protein [Euryarchaeota archaeon]|tara:strand:- start:36572 stop:38725 length:2154 start_codon:yes stop_codon:yes gene_type:complete